MTRCSSLGSIIVGGKTVGTVQCCLDAGHDEEQWQHPYGGVLTADEYAAENRRRFDRAAWPKIEPTPHRAVLEWENDTVTPDLDLLDPDEELVDPLA